MKFTCSKCRVYGLHCSGGKRSLMRPSWQGCSLQGPWGQQAGKLMGPRVYERPTTAMHGEHFNPGLSAPEVSLAQCSVESARVRFMTYAEGCNGLELWVQGPSMDCILICKCCQISAGAHRLSEPVGHQWVTSQLHVPPPPVSDSSQLIR